MINLLLPEAKKQIRAGRTNVILVNYLLAIGLAACVMAGIFAIGWFATDNDRQSAEAARAANKNAMNNFHETRAAAEEFAKNLTVAKTILTSEVSLTQLLINIASNVPSGVILSNLTLGTTTSTAPIAISGRASSYNDAVRLKNSLEASDIFEKVSITSVAQADTSAQTDPVASRYPFAVNLQAQFTKQSSGGAQK